MALMKQYSRPSKGKDPLSTTISEYHARVVSEQARQFRVPRQELLAEIRKAQSQLLSVVQNLNCYRNQEI